MSVDELDQCNEMVGKEDNRHSNVSRKISLVREGSNTKQYFPFKHGYLSVATLRVGSEGIQMTVDGKHITSFAFREVISLIYFLSSCCFLLVPTSKIFIFCCILFRLWSLGLLTK